MSDSDVELLRVIREEREAAAAAAAAAEAGSGDDGTSRGIPQANRSRIPRLPRTRPGRKSGEAYDWTVDDDGNVVRSDVAVVWSGEDEPDEVELPPEPDDAP